MRCWPRAGSTSTAADRATAGGQLDQVEATQDVAALGTPKSAISGRASCGSKPRCSTAPNDDETNADPREDAPGQGRAVLAARRILQGARVERAPHAEGSGPGAARSAEPLGPRAEGAQFHAEQHRRVRRARRSACASGSTRAQLRLAGVAQQQNACSKSLARNELEQQKERIGTYQIQARFALAAIYDRAARHRRGAEGRAAESQGEPNVPGRRREAARPDSARRRPERHPTSPATAARPTRRRLPTEAPK